MGTEVSSSPKIAGREVALYVKDRFKDELVRNEAFKKGDYGRALTETFIRMD